jgi:hypothetical protein
MYHVKKYTFKVCFKPYLSPRYTVKTAGEALVLFFLVLGGAYTGPFHA